MADIRTPHTDGSVARDPALLTGAEMLGLGITGLGLIMAGSTIFISHRDPFEVRT